MDMKITPRFFIFYFSIFICLHTALSQNNPVFLDESTHWADSIMNTLSLEERIAQLFMIVAYSNKDNIHRQEVVHLIKEYKIGGLMFLQGGPLRQASLTNHYQSISNTPLMIALDAEWGVSMRLDSALRFPWQMTLGAIEDTNLIYQMGVEIARQCKLLGVHINFAPVIDVNSNPKNPIINNRSFGENPEKVATMGIAYMKGLQDNNILACAKHFPGHGDTDADSHKTLPTVHHSRNRIEEVDLLPFKKLIDQGLGSVMIAHLNIPSLDSTKDLAVSLSQKVVTNLLKEDLGFGGLAITDALNMKAVSNFYDPGIVDLNALFAGNDVLLFAQDVPKAIEEIKKAIKEERINQEDIDARCHKILMAKKWMGLDQYNPCNLERVKNEVITKKTKLLDKKLVQSSLTLLQNFDDFLPLRSLDTLKIASVSIGDSALSFKRMLSHYAQIKHFTISEKATLSEQAILLNKLSSYNLILVSLHKSNVTAWESYQIDKEVDILLQSIALQSKVVVSIFANPYSINSFLFTNNFDGLILSYQNSNIAQEQTAQAIFGGLGINGKIPVTTKHFKIQSGLNTNQFRMRYVTPEEIQLKSDFIYKIDSIVEHAINEEATPGCQILIAKDGNIFFNKSYGYHTYKKQKEVNNFDIYDLASITKIIATVPILMQMVDNDDLDLDDKLKNYLDLSSSDKGDLVIREILSHQAKLTPWIPFYKTTLVEDSISGLMSLRDTLYNNIYSDQYPFKVADNIYLHQYYQDSIRLQVQESDLLDKKEYCYSDLGYYFFKDIIEEKYKNSLDIVLNKHFYKSLGMENLGYLPLERIDSNRIVPSEIDFKFRGQILKGYVNDQGAAMQGGVGGHAGVFSNANDLAKFMQMYLQKGEYAGKRYLSKEIVKEFTKCQFCSDENRRGAGFDKPVIEGQEGGPTCHCVSSLSFGHSGFTGTLAWVDPSTNLIYIFLSNRVYPDASNIKLLDMNVRTEIMQVIYDSFDE